MNIARVLIPSTRLIIINNKKPFSLKTFKILATTITTDPPSNNNVKSNSTRQISLFEARSVHETDESFVSKMLKKIPFMKFNRTKIMAAGYFLYESAADQINYLDFFEELNLPDTFYSWFVVTELHVWMLSARAMAEGEEGQMLRNNIVAALWSDVSQRVKKLGASSAKTKDQINELSEQLQATLIAYDEGLQTDDIVLAGALWRRFYQHMDVSPENLDVLVKYVRRQVRLLDGMSGASFFQQKEIHWEPFSKFRQHDSSNG